jgi:hypothetical protein
MCDQRLRCQGSVDSECTQRCVTKVGPPHILSRDALVLYEQCTRDPACLDDDDCEAAMRVRDPAVDKEMAACSAFVRTCPSQTEGGLCLRIGPLLAEVRAKWSACYSGTCSNTGQFLDCLEAASMP